MYKTEVYLRDDQSNFLRDLSFVESKRFGKRISVAEIIRSAVDILMKSKKEKVHKETRLILSDSQFMGDIKQARRELAKGKYLTSTKEVFGE